MALHNVHNKEMRLVLSSDAKPRLKWTPELHQCFIDAVNHLGGPEKATPKSLMRVMGIHGLTLYHLKSHLQKYRLGRTQQSQNHQQNKPEGTGHGIKLCEQTDEMKHNTFSNSDGEESHFINKIGDAASEQNNDLKVAHALKMQMEVQRKLHEQIEVQRHLQLRIEAQGKYLQSVLRKAQETLSGYSSCSIEVEQAKAQLSQLMSMVVSGYPNSSFSVLTDSEGSILKDAENNLLGHNGYSVDSSLTSSDSSGRKEITESKLHTLEDRKHSSGKTSKRNRNSATLSLMEMHSSETRKKSKNTIDEVNQAGQLTGENSNDTQAERYRATEIIDLNCKYLNGFDSHPKLIDLNFIGVEPFNESQC